MDIERLKALAARNKKVATLLKVFGDDERVLARLAEHLDLVETKDAGDVRIAYKGAKMRDGLDVGNALRSALETVEDAVWERYTRGDDERALEMARSLIARCKQALDPTSEPDLYDELAQAIAAVGRDTVKQALKALVSMGGNGRETMTSSGPQSVATKAAQRDPYAQAVQTGPPRGWRPN